MLIDIDILRLHRERGLGNISEGRVTAKKRQWEREEEMVSLQMSSFPLIFVLN